MTAARTMLRYGALAVPLAFAGLPIYVHLPKFYAATQHMPLALLGVILLAVRLFDCLIDPLIGWLGDRYPHLRRRLMVGAAPVMVLAYYALFNPPGFASTPEQAGWLAGGLLLVYLSFSVLMIFYYAAGVTLAANDRDATRISAYREVLMLVGVLLASVLPALLANAFGPSMAYHALAILFALVMAVGVSLTLPMAVFAAAPQARAPMDAGAFRVCLGDPAIRHVLSVLFVNALASAVTGTLFLFFVADVLRMDDAAAGLFLALYFITAALAIPLWVQAAKRLGERRALALGMALAVVAFMFTGFLGPGQGLAFAIICALSGMAVGADLALLPALFAQALARQPGRSGVGFGLWNFLSKLTLALAAGIALPLLAQAGYQPGVAGSSITALSLAYALLPCLIKLIALVLLLAHPTVKRSLV